MRYELKLVCAGTHLHQVRLWMRLHPAGIRTAYPPRWVNSLYFDTYQLSALTDNLEGMAQRRKLRLRWYGELNHAEMPILEMKVKQGLVGSKEQLALGSDLSLLQPWRRILSKVHKELTPVWRTRFQATAQPTLLNRYWREYYHTADRTVRVTVDSGQIAYDQRLAARPNLRVALPIQDLIIIEIKADQACADHAQAVANAFPISRTRNSKYAKGVLTALCSR